MRPCAFCGGRTDCAEHVIPQWVYQAFGNLPFTIVEEETGRDTRSWRGKRKEEGKKVRWICQTCNGTRLGALEDRSKPLLMPLIQGRAAAVSNRDAALLASWVTKTVMVAEFTTENPIQHHFALDHRRTFVNTLVPPDNTVVWLGRLTGDMRGFVAVNHFDLTIIPDPFGLTPIPILVGTIGIDRFLAQMMSYQRLGLAAHPIDLRMKCRGDWHSRQVCIWPPSDFVAWPPSKSVAGKHLQAFHERSLRAYTPDANAHPTD